MKIAGNISIELGDDVFELRPTLRCAMNLAHRSGGFKVLVRDLLDQSITAAIDCIGPHCLYSRKYLAELVLKADANHIQFKTLEYVMACAAIDTDADNQTSAPKPAQQGETQTYEEFFHQLYRWGTGWLGWTPEATLNATPFEIIEAHTGRMQMLRAIFGSNEKTEPKDDLPLEDKFRRVFAGRGTIQGAA